MQVDFSLIKLIIWDLDETFWQGTLSEGPINPIQDHIQLIHDLTDCGIVNTICSKNDAANVDKTLNKLNIHSLFVFNSINWDPKGPRIASLIKDMGLRPTNCLFIDDNIVNLNEAKFYSPELIIAEPSIIPELIKYAENIPKNDTTHSRLKNYKTLELKNEAKANATDNLAFLYSSNTQVEIFQDCIKEIDRIHELIIRTNQLNFTKNRMSKQELEEMLTDSSVSAGYVKVKDNYGDYGIIGFYAIKSHKLVHFLFSCRTIGQGVEQYVYAKIGHPKLEIIGEVVNTVDSNCAPEWINQTKIKNTRQLKHKQNHKILFKGGCDLMNMTTYLNTAFVFEEFTYISPSRFNTIEHNYHTTNLLSFPFLSKEERELHLATYCFADENMFDSKIFDPDISIAFLGTMIEPNLGVYKNKLTGNRIAFGEYSHPLTDPNEWENYINGTIFTSDNKFTKEWLESFSLDHEFLGALSPYEIISEYKKLLSLMNPKAYLCLLLGSETPFLNESNPNYFGRELVYKKINNLIRDWAKSETRVLLIDFNDFIKSQSDFNNNINHFQRRVYFEAANVANRYISSLSGAKLKQKSYIYMWIKSQIDKLSNTGFFQTKLYSILRIPYYWIRSKF